VVGSGNVTHNLRALKWEEKHAAAEEFAAGFDEDLTKVVVGLKGREREEGIKGMFRHKFFRLSHPTCEHLVPLCVAAGVAHNFEGRRVHYDMLYGTLSMTCYAF